MASILGWAGTLCWPNTTYQGSRSSLANRTTTLDEYVYTPDDQLIEGEIEAGKRYG